MLEVHTQQSFSLSFKGDFFFSFCQTWKISDTTFILPSTKPHNCPAMSQNHSYYTLQSELFGMFDMSFKRSMWKQTVHT